MTDSELGSAKKSRTAIEAIKAYEGYGKEVD